MDPRTKELLDLFESVVHLGAEAREVVLRRLTPDESIRRDVQRLLSAHDSEPDRFDTTAPEAFAELLRTPNESLSHFTIIREIGRGGMGTVYLAKDTQLNRESALKILDPVQSLSLTARAAFLHEARAAAGLSHPNIIAIHSYGEAEDACYIAMQHVPTGTLADWIERERERTSPNNWWRRVAGVVADVADALQHAHRKGVVHRDVKPRNVLMAPDDHPILADFGIATVTSADSPAPTGGVGTLVYMSPEQLECAQNPIDARTDIYSLGVVLFEAVAGESPFAGESDDEIRQAKLAGAMPRLHASIPAPKGLAEVCARALAREPDNRYREAAVFAADLRTLIERGALGSRRIARRSAIVAVAALGAGGTLGVYAYRRATDTRPRVLTAALAPSDRVFARRIDIQSGLVGEPVRLGRARSGPFRVEEGYVRFVVVDAEGRCSEQARFIERGEDLSLDPPPRTIPPPDAMALVSPERLPRDAPDAWTRAVGAGYWIDQNETSNGEYEAYLSAAGRGRPEPVVWNGAERTERWRRLPVTCVSWPEARAYAESVGKRLPTELEWELAARGPLLRRYPWGNEGDPARLGAVNAGRLPDGKTPPAKHGGHSDGVRRTDQERRELASYLSSNLRTPEQAGADWTDDLGLTHVLGNVIEWVESIPPTEGPAFRRARSRSWSDPPGALDSGAGRYSIDSRRIGIGFRCARSFQIPGGKP